MVDFRNVDQDVGSEDRVLYVLDLCREDRVYLADPACLLDRVAGRVVLVVALANLVEEDLVDHAGLDSLYLGSSLTLAGLSDHEDPDHADP